VGAADSHDLDGLVACLERVLGERAR
jgi:hypothetical protein